MKHLKKQNLAITFSLLLLTFLSANLLPLKDFNSANELPANNLNQKDVEKKISVLEMPFMENVGQTNEKVKYYAQLNIGTVFVDKGGVLTYALNDKDKSYAIKETLLGQKEPNPEGTTKDSTTISSFIGNNQSKWKTSIPNYLGVSLGEVFDGINVDLKAHNKNVEKIFTVKPTSDPSQIKIKLEGAEKLQINDQGELEMLTGNGGSIAMTKPVAYQEKNNEKVPVEVAYNLLDKSTYGFKVGSYDNSKALIIDPLLASTYLGGSEDSEEGNALVGGNGELLVAFDGATEYVFVGATTFSNDFPTTVGAYDTVSGGFSDNFIAKFNLNLTDMVAGTYIGGSSYEDRATLDMAPDGNIFLLARSQSTDYPIIDPFPGNATINPYQTALNGTSYDLVITKISPSLTAAPLASTYLGGTSGGEWGTGIAFGSSFCPVNQSTSTAPPYCVYITADGISSTPTTAINLASGYDPTFNGGFSNKYVALLDNNLSNQYFTATYLGQGFYGALAVSSSGKVFVHGASTSGSDPVVRANSGTPSYQETFGGVRDSYLARLSANLATLEASTYFGGPTYEVDLTNTIRIFGSGANEQIFITADIYKGTELEDAVTANPNTISINTFGPLSSPAIPGDDVFIARFNNDLTNARVAIVGGSDTENTPYIDLDSNGNAFIVSGGWSSDYPTTTGAYEETDPDVNDSDFMISKFNNDLTNQISATYIGGSGYDSLPCGLEVDSEDNIFICGETDSSDYPTTAGADDTTLGGGWDLVLSKFSNQLNFVDGPPSAITNLQATPGDQQVDLTWSAPNDNGFTLTSYEVHYSNDGFATDDQTCVTSDCTDLTTGATVAGLTNGIEYSFRVYSYSSQGISPASNTVTATPSAPSSASVEIHIGSINADFNNTTIGISDGNNGSNDINSFSTPATEAALSGNFPAAVSFSFDGSGVPTESSIPYSLVTLDGSRTVVNLSDDLVSSSISLPFAVSMFGRNNDTIKISSNGFIYLNQSNVTSVDSRCCEGELLSSVTDTVDHLVAGLWTDMYPPGSGEISYETIGSSPNRIFVVQFSNISQCCDSNGGNSFQIQLHESSGGGGPSAPAAISDLQANPGDQQVDLTWSAPNNNGDPLTSYEVHYSDDGFATDQTCATTDCTDLTTGATITGLTNGIQYSFRVYSYNSIGISPVSNTVTATPNPPSAPDAIIDLAGTPADQRVFLTWSAPNNNGSPLTSYEVHYSNDGFATDDQTCVTVECTDLTAGTNVTGLTNGIEYSFRVYTYNSIGISQVSNTVTATPFNTNGPPAQWPNPNNPTDQIIATGTDDQTIPRAVRTSDGNYIVFYTQSTLSGTLIYAQKVDQSSGATLWVSPTSVSTQPESYSTSNSYSTASNDNGAFIAFTRISDTEFPPDSNIYVQKVDSDGNILWGGTGINVTLSNVSTLTENSPLLVSDGAGGVYVAWDVAGSLGSSEVYITHLDSTGAVATNWNTTGVDSFRTVHVEASSGSSEQLGSDMWLQADGNIAVPFSHTASGFPVEVTAEIIVVDAQGAGESPSILLSNAGTTIGQFRAAPYGNYGAFAVFATNGDVYAQRVDDNWNKEWGTDGIIASGADGNFLTAIPDGSGGLIAVWSVYEDADFGGTYGTHVLSNGTVDPSWGGTDVTIARIDGDAETLYNKYSAISDGAGGAFVAFNSNNTGNIYVQHLKSDGTLGISGKGYLLGNADNGGDNLDQFLVSDGRTGVAVFWYGWNDINSFDIFGQYLLPQASAGVPDAINDLAASPGDGQVTLNWTAPYDNGSAITNYIIQYDNGSGFVTFPDGTNTNTSVVVTGLTNYVNYDFRVIAVNDNGQGAASNIANATPVPCVGIRSNIEVDDSPITTVSDECLGVNVLSGGLSLPHVPDSFSFPRKLTSSFFQDSFSNDDPATRNTVDVTMGPEDVITASDLTGSTDGFNVTITSSTFSNGTDTLLLGDLYVLGETPSSTILNALDPNLNGTPNSPNGLVYAAGSSGLDLVGLSAGEGSLNNASSYTGKGRPFDNNADQVPDIVPLINAPNGSPHMLTVSQGLNFYLRIPADQPSGNYSIIFTVDITPDT